MALNDKNILITPNIGSSTADPKIDFVGASTNTGPSTITATVYSTNNGTLSFDASEGTLFSISNSLSSGSIFSVNPISGIPIIDVNADRTIALNPFGGNTGIGTTNPLSKLSVVGDVRVSGVVTATTFIGNLTGTATTATNLADAANITTGTINKDRISTTNALTVLGDLYVSNNISFGGTTTQLNLQQLQIVDADIVLGIGTSFSPTDNTANHGGIAIASTEGTPLVSLNIVPEETNPSTYKKIMWFKGSSIGAGITDAWLANYAVGIGSTNVPNNVYLAAGNVQITKNDLKLPGALYDSNSSTGTSGQTLTSTGVGVSWKTSSLITPYTNTTNVTVANTTTETTLLTYALPASPATNTFFRMELRGTYLNNSGSNRTLRFLYKLDGTTILDTGVSGNLGSNAATREWNISGILAVTGTNQQNWFSRGEIGPTTNWGNPTQRFTMFNTGAVNLSTSKNLTISVIHSFAATTITLDLEMYSIDTVLPS